MGNRLPEPDSRLQTDLFPADNAHETPGVNLEPLQPTGDPYTPAVGARSPKAAAARPEFSGEKMDAEIESIRVERKGPVATVIIDRPAVRNAIDLETAERLATAFRDFEADESALAAVLWGAGGTFCAGADLKALESGRFNRVEPEGDGPLGPTRMSLSKPVVAAISGYAVAGGLELALWCDLRIIEEDAVLGVFCRQWGVPLVDGGTVRLPRLIGLGRALDLILTGRPVGAAEALSMGLATRIVPTGQSREAAEALALEIAAFPQECLKGDRRSVYEQQGLPLAEALRNEYRLGLRGLRKEAVSAGRLFARRRRRDSVAERGVVPEEGE